MKLLLLLGLSLGSPPRVTRRRRVPTSRRQVRRRLLVALFAASTLQWTTRKPRIQTSQSTKRVQLFHPVQNRPTAVAPRAGCKRTLMRSGRPHTRRLPTPRERISTIRNRIQRLKVRCGGRRPRSSAGGNLCTTRDSRDSFRVPTSTRGSTKAGTTTTTRRTLGAICSGSAAFTACWTPTEFRAGAFRNKWLARRAGPAPGRGVCAQGSPPSGRPAACRQAPWPARKRCGPPAPNARPPPTPPFPIRPRSRPQAQARPKAQQPESHQTA